MVGWVDGQKKRKLRHALVGEPPNVYPVHIQVEWCVRYSEASRDQFHHASARILSRSIPHQWNKFIVSSSFVRRILRSYLHVSIHQFGRSWQYNLRRSKQTMLYYISKQVPDISSI